MKPRRKSFKTNDHLQEYLEQINWDRIFFKGQLILGWLLLTALFGYFLWSSYN